MTGRTTRSSTVHSAALVLTAAAVVLSPAWIQDTPCEEGDARARSIPELIESFSYTFSKILTPEEYELYRTRRPQEIKEADRELYRKISQNVERWTDDWILWAARNLDRLPESRLQGAVATSERIDHLVASYFDARGWRYRRLEVVFLPQRLFHDPRNRGWTGLGVFIPFYPDVFFSTVDPAAPLELILVHESIHYNKRGASLGHPLDEGITDTAARHIVKLHELLPGKALREHRTYPRERKLVETVLQSVVDKAGVQPEAALDLLLAAYLTGEQSAMDRVFGAEAWARAVELSRSERDFGRLQRGVEQELQ